MSEHDYYATHQTPPQFGDQPAADWAGQVTADHPADEEPPAAAAVAEPETEVRTPEFGAAPTPEPVHVEDEAAPEPETAEEPASETAEEADADTAEEPTSETAEEAEPETAEQPTSETAEEADAATDGDEHLIDPADADRFQSRWREVKASFVDDPSDAVRRAGALTGEAVDEVTTALTHLRQSLDAQAQDADRADTEQLRLMLRGYGSLLERILTR